MKIASLLANVISSIAPSPKEVKEESDFAAGLVSKISQFVPDGAKVAVMGSIAKGTFLRDSKDIDIFILLPKTTERSEFEKIARDAALVAFPDAKKEIKYAEHPYVRVFSEGRQIDLVPAYLIEKISEKMSSVDRSVLHTKYILKKLGAGAAGKKSQVLLLKKFMKANGIYGAEIKVLGFSGYLCELLVLKYGSFVSVLKAASKWKEPVFVDIEQYYQKQKKEKKAKSDEMEKLIARFDAPLIIIDPVDENRNVSAAVSKENFKRFISLSKMFVKKPSEKFFFSVPQSFDEKLEKLGVVRKGKGSHYLISIKRQDIVDDILWGQLRKLDCALVSFLGKQEFEVTGCMADANDKECRIAISFAKEALPSTRLLKGPELKLVKNVKEFRKAHKKGKFLVKKKRVYAIVKRKLVFAKDAIEEFFDNSILPSHLNDKKGMKVEKI
ncbi:MAG: CCA tRNA nucleotidyltransferase [Candidatus Micrarchaeia archaeon]